MAGMAESGTSSINPQSTVLSSFMQAPTDITFLSPSKTSRSFRLSKSFFSCANGKFLGGLMLKPRAAVADEAASIVRSRAIGRPQSYSLDMVIEMNLPVSSIDDILEIDSILSSQPTSVSLSAT